MKLQDAQFILRALRSDGRYRTNDPLFAEALAETQGNPELEAWLSREQAIDRTVAHKLDGLAPPPGLRDAILVGARASRLARPWRRNPVWLAAAAIAMTLALSFVLLTRQRQDGPGLTAFASLALQHLEQGPHSHDVAAGVNALPAELAAATGPLTALASIDADTLRDRGCHSFSFAGHEVVEVCFERDGLQYHLYAMRRDPQSNVAPGAVPLLVEQATTAAAAWATATTLFSVASRQGPDAIRRLF